VYNFYNVALFVSSGDSFSNQTATGSINQLSRIQSFDFSIDFNRDLVQYTDLSFENAKNKAPIVNFNYNYLVTNGQNEKKVGLLVNRTGESVFKNLNTEKNFYLLASNNNKEPNLSNIGSCNIFGLGNCLINEYLVSAEVGKFVVSNINGQALNVDSYTGNPINLISPALADNGQLYGNQFSIISGSSLFNENGSFPEQISALSHGDIMMEIPIDFGFATHMSGSNSCLLQNFTLRIGIQRDENYIMGKYSPNRQMKMPVSVDLSADIILTKLQQDSLARGCYDESKDIKIIIKKPCTDFLAIEYFIKGLKLTTASFSSSISNRIVGSFSWKGYVTDFNSSKLNVYATEAFDNNSPSSYVLDYCSSITGTDEFGQQFISEECFYKRIQT